jgi:TonB family protein
MNHLLGFLIAALLTLPSVGATTGFADEPDLDEWESFQSLQPPLALTRVRPKYPAQARLAGTEGTVQLWALVGLDGRVKGMRVKQSVPGLDHAAREAVAQWLFRPARRGNGDPTQFIVPIRVRFDSALGTRGAGWIDAPPRLRKAAPLGYPLRALRAGIEGTVVVHAFVDEAGIARQTWIARSQDMLDAAAEAHVRASRFIPAQSQGKPATAWVAVPVRFNLD